MVNLLSNILPDRNLTCDQFMIHCCRAINRYSPFHVPAKTKQTECEVLSISISLMGPALWRRSTESVCPARWEKESAVCREGIGEGVEEEVMNGRKLSRSRWGTQGGSTGERPTDGRGLGGVKAGWWGWMGT